MSEVDPTYYVTDYDGSICKDKTDVSLDESQVCEILNQQADEIERLTTLVTSGNCIRGENGTAPCERLRAAIEKIRTTVREPYVSDDSQAVLVDKIGIAALYPEGGARGE